MELKPGYKQTDVGVIPEEWGVVSVRDIGQVKTGPFGTLLQADEYSGREGTPLISVREIGEGILRVDERTPLVPDSVVRRLPEYVLKPGDIVFGRKGAVDRSALVNEEQSGFFLSSDGIRIRPWRSYHPPFVAYQFQRSKVQSWLLQNATGTTMASMNPEILRRVSLPVPPLSEQCAIAGALGDVDALLGALTRLIVKKRDLKQAAMQQLLTGQTRLPDFGVEWEVKRFEEIAVPRAERIDPRRAGIQDFCVELEHIERASGRLLGSTATDEHSSLKTVFRVGDVLFGKLRAYLRKYWFADRDGVCSTEIWALVAQRRRATPEFLFQMVQVDGFLEVASSAYGTHMPRSDWNVVKNYKAPLPSVKEQTAIATVLSTMDAELAALEQRLAKTRALKQGMMQELLTGRTRLA